MLSWGPLQTNQDVEPICANRHAAISEAQAEFLMKGGRTHRRRTIALKISPAYALRAIYWPGGVSNFAVAHAPRSTLSGVPNGADIGVEAKGGVVTLAGTVGSLAEKYESERRASKSRA